MFFYLFSIKIISFPLDNVVWRNKFQIKQIFLLDKTVYHAFHYIIESDGVANLQRSPASKEHWNEVGIEGWIEQVSWRAAFLKLMEILIPASN